MSKNINKLYPLEGLRGVAAFVVLLGHLRHTFFLKPGIPGTLRNKYGELLQRLCLMVTLQFGSSG